MADPRCQRCQRDISKPALVRCRDAECPLKAEPERASSSRVIGLVLGGVVAVAALLFWASTGSPPPRQPVVADGTRVITPHTAPSITTGNSGPGLFDWLTRSEKPVTVTGDSLPIGQEIPDKRAASRVQSFSCDGDTTIGRMLICTHWSLATTDYNMALLYNDALSRAPDPRSLARARRKWLARLDKQGVDAASIMALYEEWRAELSRTTG